MRAISYSDLSPSDWNAVVRASSEAWLFHRHEWVGIEAAHFASENHSFGVLDGTELIGVVPLYVQLVPVGFEERLVHSGIHRCAGPAFVDGLPEDVCSAARSVARRRIFEVAAEAGADRIQLGVQNLAPAWLDPGGCRLPFWAAWPGVWMGLQMGPGGIAPAPGMATLALDQVVFPDRSEEELFRSLAASCRRAVRKAERSGLVVEEHDLPGFLADWTRLARLSAARTGERLAEPSYFEAVGRIGGPGSGSRVLAARAGHEFVGALLLLYDKDCVHFLAGVSDPAWLDRRVNDLLHWNAIRWSLNRGARAYRLGPVFPELPEEWPVSRVSRFKKKFGGVSLPVVQGSVFLRPDRYRDLGVTQLDLRIRAAGKGASAPHPEPRGKVEVLGVVPADLEPFFRCYGFFGAGRMGGAHRNLRILLGDAELPPGVQARRQDGPAELHRAKRVPGERPGDPFYRALLGYVSYRGSELDPLVVDGRGEMVVAVLRRGSTPWLLCGLDLAEEALRWRQGDPDQATRAGDRGGFGFDFERPIYLFRDQLDPTRPWMPWLDRLGHQLVAWIQELAGAPIVEPLPGGARGLVVATGDDDEAHLEKYWEQQRVLGNLPMTYMLMPTTRHGRESLRGLGDHVEFGVHVDALREPEAYDKHCAEQTAAIRKLTGAPCSTVRNHGFLNRGYWGHLRAWEQSGLILDVNLPGVDGTALNGSFLPMRVRRPDGSWSEHWSLLTAFGDGMVTTLGKGRLATARALRRAVKLVEATGPGALVFNLHPQNVRETRWLHRLVSALARRRHWRAVGLEDYAQWVAARERVEIERRGGSWAVRSAVPMRGLVLRWPGGRRTELGGAAGFAGSELVDVS